MNLASRPPLTDTQRSLAASAWPVALAIAGRFARGKAWLHGDLVGAASLALCRAAHDYRPGGPATFRSFAGHRIEGACLEAIRDAFKEGFRAGRGVRPAVLSLDIILDMPIDVADAGVSAADEPASGDLPVGWEVDSADAVHVLCGHLPGGYAAIMRAFYGEAASASKVEAARRFGVHPSYVSQVHKRSIVLMRSAVGA